MPASSSWRPGSPNSHSDYGGVLSAIRHHLSVIKRQSRFSIEKIPFYSKFIDREQLLKLAQKLEKSGYGDYLLRVAK